MNFKKQIHQLIHGCGRTQLCSGEILREHKIV